jgi:ParB family transcriptional regulator, chromosome partitioning protein
MPLQLDFLPTLEDTAPVQGRPLILPIAQIDEDPSQPRSEFDAEALAELSRTIAARGVLQPVSVRPHPERAGRWMLNFGARRLRASKLAGKSEIACFVNEGTDPYAKVIENEHREGLKPLELALFVKGELKRGKSRAEVAREMGKSGGYISIVCALIDAPDWLVEVYQRGQCRGMTELYELRRIYEEQPKEARRLIESGVSITRGELVRLGGNVPTVPVAQLQPERSDANEPARVGDKAETPSSDSAQPADRAGQPLKPPTNRDHLVLLAETPEGNVEVVLGDLPQCRDAVFVVDSVSKGRHKASLDQLRDLRLVRL